MKSIENLSDHELKLTARKIEAEAKLRANRRAAASAILIILKKYKLSIRDLPDLNLGQTNSKRLRKKSSTEPKRPRKTEVPNKQKIDKRAKVAFKYKDPKSRNKWSGRGRSPKWVTDILAKDRISMAQFKADKRYRI